MFKEKKINENAIKKDFFKVKKDFKKKCYVNISSKTNENIFVKENELQNVKLPRENETIFLITSKSRSLVNFLINKNPNEIYLFCSRLNEKSFNIIKNKNLKGIGLSERVLEKKPNFYTEVSSVTKLKFKRNHSKMLLFKIDNNFYIITGSGNASINSRIENYILENNKQKYNQIKSFFENA